MAQGFDGLVQVVEENFGESELAERFGITRYPAVFVNEVLVAKPKDFGFFGQSGSQGKGRYTPWLNDESRALFRTDMERIVGQAVKGELESGVVVEEDSGSALTQLPQFLLEDVDGFTIDSDLYRNSVTVVEFWATWCPPCIKALPTLRKLQLDHEEDLLLLGIAVESKLEDVRGIVAQYELPFPNVLGSAELAQSFGDLVAVPTTFVFARGGKLVRAFYGAPPELGSELETLVQELIAQDAGEGR